VFTTDFDEYRIVVNQSAGTAYSGITANPRSGGADISANLSSNFIYPSGASLVSATFASWRVSDFQATASGMATFEMSLFNPMNTTYHTTYISNTQFPDTSTTSTRVLGSGSWRVTTQMQGIKFTASSSQTARVTIYGKRK
jgi:hypothetical protein